MAAFWPVRVSTIGKPTRTGGSPSAPPKHHHPARRLDDVIDRRPVAARAILSVARDRTEHDVRVEHLHVFVAEAETADHAGPEILDQNVGPLDDAACDAQVFRVLEIERDRLLAGVRGNERRTHAVEAGHRRNKRPAIGLASNAKGTGAGRSDP